MFKKEQLSLLLPFIIVLIIACLYYPVRNFGFLNFDDDLYITNNALVLEGFSFSNCVQAFQRNLGGHYHPITWISHMIDLSLFGLHPGAHHIVNVFIHCINVILCFYLVLALLKDRRSAFIVSILFAVHPMRIESVAWLSERKDVLSMAFGLGSILCYLHSFKAHYKIWFAASLILFIVSLLSKPTFITMPVLLLLVDNWSGRTIEKRVLLEKLPYVFFAIVSALIVLFAQQSDGGLKSIDTISLVDRFSSVSVGYITYATKLFAPFYLGIFYPFKSYSVIIGILSASALFVITWILYFFRRSQKDLWHGWLWYLVSLVPMIGIVQIGGQSYADRWSYLPHIGILIALVSTLRKVSFFRSAYIWIVVAFYFSFLTYKNLPYWSDSKSIFAHTLEVSPDNFLAHTNLGNAFDAEGNLSQAAPHFEAAYRLNPTYPEASNNLGRLRASQQRFVEAESLFAEAVTRKPSFIIARYNLGLTKYELGRFYEAAQLWVKVFQDEPRYIQAQKSLSFLIQYQMDGLCGQLDQQSGEEKTLFFNDVKKIFGEDIKICNN
jgi:tetratricopeptide (TPR) repeat protein